MRRRCVNETLDMLSLLSCPGVCDLDLVGVRRAQLRDHQRRDSSRRTCYWSAISLVRFLFKSALRYQLRSIEFELARDGDQLGVTKRGACSQIHRSTICCVNLRYHPAP